MSTNVGSIHYDVDLKTSAFDKAGAGLNSKLKTMGKRMESVGATMTKFVTLPIVTGFGFSVKAAADLTETINKVDVAFGKDADRIKKWSEQTIESIGLAGSSAMEAAAMFGDMGTSMGFNTDDAASMSIQLTNLAGDLASFKNISIDQAMTALSGVFTGETESLKKLGVVMTQTNLEAFALQKGIKANWKEMSQAEKVALRYEFIMDATKNAHGDFARTADSTANQIRMTKERFKELSEELGKKLIPLANKLLNFLNRMISGWQNLNPKMQNAILIFAGITAVMGPLLLVVGKLAVAIGAIGLAATGWIAVAAAVVAGLVYLEVRFGAVSGAVQFLQDKLEPLWSFFANNILPILKSVGGFMANQLKAAFDDIKKAVKQVTDILKPHEAKLRMLAKVIGVVVMTPLLVFISTLAVLVSAIAAAIGIIARIIGWLSRLAAWFVSVGNTIAGAIGKVLGWFGRMISKAWQMYSSVKRAFDSLKSAILGAVAGFGSLLLGAGKALVQGLVDGIKSMAWAPVNAIKSIAGEVRSWLPFSPAKKGPFSGRGWTLYSGQSMMTGLAQGITSMARLPQMAMAKAMGNASGQIGDIGVVPGSGLGVNGNQTTTNFYAPVNVSQSGEAMDIMRLLGQNQELAFKGIAI